MVKRLLDVALAAVALVLASPLMLLAAIGIRLASPGRVLYRARRVGRDGKEFDMLKFRTMHATTGAGNSRVTAPEDMRVFPLGRILRLTKIDELPQLINILRGDMSVIGPRPEDPYYVDRYFTPVQRKTLSTRPGLASPGSLFHDTHGHRLLDAGDPEASYIRELLPLKLALDLVYVKRASLAYDLKLILRTLGIICAKLAGRREFRDPPEMTAARRFV
jgi:lipopolysaccharide/colanic/teichoic acid biosynthesis glycosyltransferase